MKNLSSPSRAHLIEQHIADMRLRDRIRNLQLLRLDIRIMQCELAVDQAFARAGFSAPRLLRAAIRNEGEVQRP